MIAYLVPVGKHRFELYSEPLEESSEPQRGAGRLQRWFHQAGAQWHALVEQARRGVAISRLARWRDRVICRLAESIAEQRTLWALRGCSSVTLVAPTILEPDRARAILNAALAEARRHHGRWLVIDGSLFVGSVVFFFVPGPNIVAYYFLFRLVGHLQSWRGARDGLERVTWQVESNSTLSELATLVDVPKAARASRVAAIAARLNIPRLSAFFDRAAMPSS